jgi:hypothetical protein
MPRGRGEEKGEGPDLIWKGYAVGWRVGRNNAKRDVAGVKAHRVPSLKHSGMGGAPSDDGIIVSPTPPAQGPTPPRKFRRAAVCPIPRSPSELS